MMIARIKKVVVAFSLGWILAVAANLGIAFQFSPALGQSIRPEAAAQQLYKSLDFLPLENQYQSQRSGEVAQENTLMLRFLRYHEYVKSRPSRYRFDWQLTFADYFGVNEPMKADRYPGHRNLITNPLEQDREVIANLSRDRRNEIINALLAIYNPQDQSQSASQPVESGTDNRNQAPVLPRAGSADLLLPTK